jgi:hypothetical protein
VTHNSDSSEDERILKVNGVYPEAVEELDERLPEMQEGDYVIGGTLREDFKPFVYSGLASEFPVNGESVFIITERGETVSEGYWNAEEVVQAEPEVERSEAYKVFDAESDDIAQAMITEELLTQYRRSEEQQVKNKEGENWRNYLDFGTEMLNSWEETYQRAQRAEDESLSEYADMVGNQVEKLTSDLARLADKQSSQQIEPVRNSLYELENMTDRL